MANTKGVQHDNNNKKNSNTLVMSLAALKQSKLARIVHHSKLFQQRLDDLMSRGAWAYVQVLRCVLWEVERGATFHPTGLPPSIIRTSFLWRWNGHRSCQLELHFNEACVGTILVLRGKVKMLDWKREMELHRYVKHPHYSPRSWTDCCWSERCIPSPSAEYLWLSTPAFPIQFVHPGRDNEE